MKHYSEHILLTERTQLAHSPQFSNHRLIRPDLVQLEYMEKYQVRVRNGILVRSSCTQYPERNRLEMLRKFRKIWKSINSSMEEWVDFVRIWIQNKVVITSSLVSVANAALLMDWSPCSVTSIFDFFEKFALWFVIFGFASKNTAKILDLIWEN